MLNINSDNSEIIYEDEDPAAVIKALNKMEYKNNKDIWRHFILVPKIKKFQQKQHIIPVNHLFQQARKKEVERKYEKYG